MYDIAREQVQIQFALHQFGRFGGEPGAACNRLYPCHELGKGEGFDHAVIGPRAQPFDTVLYAAHCGEHDHRSGDLRRTQRAQYREPVDFGHIRSMIRKS